MWDRHEVWIKRAGSTDFQHPVIGRLTLAGEVLGPAGKNQRIMIYQAPPETPEHDALVLLSMTAQSAGAR